MKTYSLYDAHTGRFTGAVLTMAPEMLPAHLKDGLAALEGAYDARTQRVATGTGEVIQMEAPDQSEELARVARYRRERLLALTDWVVTRAAERGEPIATDWCQYRQALRDVPEQAGFPTAIAWPAAPDTAADESLELYSASYYHSTVT